MNSSLPSSVQSVMKIKIASPCSESWERMSGTDRVRYCGACQKKVFNLSDLSEREALALVSSGREAPCVRFFERPDGTVMTSDCPKGRRRTWLARMGGAVAVLGIALLGALLVPTAGLSAGAPEWYREFLNWLSPKRIVPTMRLTMGKPCQPTQPQPPPSPVPPGGPEEPR